MPIVEIEKKPVPLPKPESDPLVTREVDTATVVGDFLKSENAVINLADGIGSLMFDRWEVDEQYEPVLDMDGYEGYFDDLQGAKSAQHMAYLKNKIDEENERRVNFSLGTPMQKATAIGSLMVTDPTVLIPAGGAAYSTYRTTGRILEGAAKTAGVVAAIETGNEAVLQANQITRTAEESFANIAASTVLGASLGGLAAGMSRVELDEITERLSQDLTVPTEQQLSTVGAQRASTTLEEEEVAGLKRIKKVYSKMPSFLRNPVIDGALSGDLETRVVTEQLADLALAKNKNFAGKANEASVESLVKAYDALRVPFYQAEKDLYKKYVARVRSEGLPVDQRIGSKADGSLTRQEFNEQVWSAGINADSHIVPEVAELAKAARENVFNPVLQRAKEVGLLKDIDEFDVKTAETWMRRMYDRDKILNDRANFKQIVLDDLIVKNEAKESIKTKLGTLLDDHDVVVKNVAKYQKKAENLKTKKAREAAEANLEKELVRLKGLQDELADVVESYQGRSAKEAQSALARFRKEAGDDAARIPSLDKTILKVSKKIRAASSLEPAELDDIAEQLIDRITDNTGGRLPYDITSNGKGFTQEAKGTRGSAKERVWDIDDLKIKDYLVKDIRSIVESYLRTMAPDNELMGKFGALEPTQVKKRIQDSYIARRNQPMVDKKTGKERPLTAKEQTKLDKEMKRDLTNVEAMWDKLRGVYGQPDDFAAPINVLERTSLGWNFVRLLGDVVASSMPDVGRPIMTQGFMNTYGKLMSTVMSDMEGLKKASKEVKEVGTALDLTMSMTTLRRMNMEDYTPTTGKIDDITQKTTSFAATAFGMNHWTSMMKTFAGISIQDSMMKAIIKMADGGKLSKRETLSLTQNFIDVDMAKRIAAQYKKHGETRDVLNIPNARSWEDQQAKNAFRAAIRKQVDETIVTPGLDKPLWMSRQGWRVIGQFKSFTFASTNRVLMAGLQQADASAFAGASSMVAIGSMVYAYKQLMAGREVSDDPRVWVVNGIDRSGVLGMFMDINNIMEKVTRGTVGINPAIGGPVMSRYANRNLAGTLLGPSFGLAQDIFGSLGAATSGEWNESDVHALRRVMPLQNAPGFRSLYDGVENAGKAFLIDN